MFTENASKLTTRIMVKQKDGTLSVGTGFFCGFNVINNHGVLAIITNKHVLENFEQIEFVLSK